MSRLSGYGGCRRYRGHTDLDDPKPLQIGTQSDRIYPLARIMSEVTIENARTLYLFRRRNAQREIHQRACDGRDGFQVCDRGGLLAGYHPLNVGARLDEIVNGWAYD